MDISALEEKRNPCPLCGGDGVSINRYQLRTTLRCEHCGLELSALRGLPHMIAMWRGFERDDD